jgi:hypothetical protein
MARTLHELFDGPFLQPLREADRFPGAEGTHVIPERMMSGNLPDQPAGLPVQPLGPDGTAPFRNLRNGRGG